jgi:hypothetical protein
MAAGSLMAARAKTRTRLRGRSLVALGLLAFVSVTSLVIWRRSVGVSTAKAIRDATITKRNLESQKVTLERDIRNAQTRQAVVGEAERRLGLHVASDSQTRVIVESEKAK